MFGIIGYGVYIPRYRIKTEEIAHVWNDDGERVKKGLMINEKSVPGIDEDVVTISVAAAKNAIKMSETNSDTIGALYVGSESHPYAVKSSAAIVAEAIDATPELMAADLEFACKAGTAGMQMCLGLVKSGMIESGMAIGADTSQGRPGDALEYSAAAGGAAYIIGTKNVIAEITDTLSYTTDTPDFWRREGQDFPLHGGRFTGEPAYFKHISNAAKNMMKRQGTKASDYDYFVPHQPNGKFPLNVSKKLGFDKEKVLPSLAVFDIGNTYSGSSPIGLAKVLDVAKAGDRILLTSYGSGSGSDAFDIKVTNAIRKSRKKVKNVQDYIDDKYYINYGVYAKYRKKLKGI